MWADGRKESDGRMLAVPQLANRMETGTQSHTIQPGFDSPNLKPQNKKIVIKKYFLRNERKKSTRPGEHRKSSEENSATRIDKAEKYKKLNKKKSRAMRRLASSRSTPGNDLSFASRKQEWCCLQHDSRSHSHTLRALFAYKRVKIWGDHHDGCSNRS